MPEICNQWFVVKASEEFYRLHWRREGPEARGCYTSLIKTSDHPVDQLKAGSRVMDQHRSHDLGTPRGE